MRGSYQRFIVQPNETLTARDKALDYVLRCINNGPQQIIAGNQESRFGEIAWAKGWVHKVMLGEHALPHYAANITASEVSGLRVDTGKY